MDSVPTRGKRPFPNKLAEAQWVLEQLPERYGAEARTKYDGLSAADRQDPLAVADMCVNIMSVARPTRDLLKDGPLSEFVGFVDGGGRRPSGLNNRNSQGQQLQGDQQQHRWRHGSASKSSVRDKYWSVEWW